MRLTPRRRLLVDREVQGALLFRTVLYWFFLLAGTSLMTLVVYAIWNPGGTLWDYYSHFLARHGMLAFATLALLPFVMFDVLRTSNRFAGPLFRMRQAVRALAAGEHVDRIAFRKNDYWCEVAEEFNQLIEYVETLKKQVPAEAQFPGESADSLATTSPQ